jgi:hypothetical protein
MFTNPTSNGEKSEAGFATSAVVVAGAVRHNDNPRPRRNNVLSRKIRDPFSKHECGSDEFAPQFNTTDRSHVSEFAAGFGFG